MSRRVVEVRTGSLRYYQVLSAGERSATIERVLRARDEAAKAEALEIGLDASTPRESLVSAGRAILARPADDGFRYLVFDVALAKRSEFLYFQDWSQTGDGFYYLRVLDRHAGVWQSVSLEAQSGAPAISRSAKPICKTHCDRAFGGEVWLNVLNQMVGCPPSSWTPTTSPSTGDTRSESRKSHFTRVAEGGGRHGLWSLRGAGASTLGER